MNIPLRTLLFCIFFSTACSESVRFGNSLSEQEEAFLRERKKRIRKTLSSILNINLALDDVPTIAFCCSGGGYRAMLASLGALESAAQPYQPSGTRFWQSLLEYVGALFSFEHATVQAGMPEIEKPNSLLQLTTYCAALSGSAWGIGGWIQSGLSVSQYLKLTRHNISYHLFENMKVDHILHALKQKQSIAHPNSLIDVFGVLLADTLLHGLGVDNPTSFKFSDQARYVSSGIVPMPLYSALLGDDVPSYEWVEFNPFEISCSYLHSSIPSHAFGNRWSQGICKKIRAKPSLAWCMGIWGGMTLNAKEFFDRLGQPLLESIFPFVSATSKKALTDHRISPAQVFNWNYKITDAPLATKKVITLIDAGIDFKLPLPLLLRAERAVDIIIVIDASDREIGQELKAAQEYAHRHDLKFPPIDESQLSKPCSIHYDQHDPSIPIIIYLPLVQNPTYENGWDPRKADFVSWYDFKYTIEESGLVSGLAHHTMQENMQLILQTIKQWVEMRKTH